MFGMAFEPRRLRLQHIAHGDYAFLQSECGVAQVLVGFLTAAPGGLQALCRLLHLLPVLAHLQFHLLSGLVKF